MGQLFDPKYGPVVGLGPFHVQNLDTALTSTQLVLNNVAGMIAAPAAPSAGTIVGISVYANAAPSAGSATFFPSSAGAVIVGGATAVVDSVTNTNGSTGLQTSARQITFAKGARLGVMATTTTNLAATTVDYAATLWVRFDPDGGALA